MSETGGLLFAPALEASVLAVFCGGVLGGGDGRVGTFCGGVLGGEGRGAAPGVPGAREGIGVGRLGECVAGAAIGPLERGTFEGGVVGVRTGPLGSRGTDGIRPDPRGGGSVLRREGSSPSLVSFPGAAGSDGSRVT